jgi:hypothetical protein
MAAHRSPAARILAAEAALISLRVKAAKSAAIESDPEIQKKLAEIAQEKKNRTKYKVLLAETGAQSCKVRREEKMKWIAEIDELEADARARLPEIDGQIEALERELETLVREKTSSQSANAKG